MLKKDKAQKSHFGDFWNVVHKDIVPETHQGARGDPLYTMP